MSKTKNINISATIDKLYFHFKDEKPIDLMNFGEALVIFDGKEVHIIDRGEPVNAYEDDRTTNKVEFHYDHDDWIGTVYIHGQADPIVLTPRTDVFLTMNDKATILFRPRPPIKVKPAEPQISVKRAYSGTSWATDTKYYVIAPLVIIGIIAVVGGVYFSSRKTPVRGPL